jgi:outer membrane protein assembly factor BamD (BamD/ComL family)
MTIVGALVLAFGAAHAAGEWEWTEGQGWMQGAGVARPTPKEQLHYAYQLEQRSEFMDAARQYFLLVQNFPSSEEAGVGLQRLARCLFEMENYYTSYKAIEQVIETYPNTGRMSDLVEIELRIAKKLMVSQTPDILSGREENTRDFNIRRALEILDAVIEHDPYGPVAAEAYLVKGEGHLFINEVAAARTAFETIRDEFPRSDFVERARLGILQCDSLLGQASPQELAEQIEVVRETERERLDQANRSPEEIDEMDDVEHSIRQLSEIEAGKMMEQAEQYRRMGTRKGVQSSEFLYKEIVRRYPSTPQAEDAMARLGNIRIPREESRLTKAVKNINLNPFTYNKDPEPPWIVPQLDAEDMVMVDSGLGPIAGVPETGLPGTSYSTSVRPAGLREPEERAATNFSTLSAGPAPEFIDGIAGQRTYSSAPGVGGGIGLPAAPRSTASALARAPEADLVLPPGSVSRSFSQTDSAVHPYQASGAPAQERPFDPGLPNPNLGRTVDNTPYSDLVGPMADDYGRPGGGYSPAPPPPGGYAADPGYAVPPSRTLPGGGYSAPGGGGGWSFSDDLR